MEEFEAHLPSPSIIAEPVKIPISSLGICGEDDFSRARLKEGRLSDGRQGTIGSKRVDMLRI